MKAMRWHGRRDVRVDTVPEPVPQDDELLIRVEWGGVCGSDLEEYREGPVTIPVRPHPLRHTLAPIVLGHEVVGVVEQAARDGSGPAVGSRVVPDVVIGCGRCWWCQRHEEGLCPLLSVRGQTEDGGLANFMVARARSCLVVPTNLTAEEAALTEPASVAVRALRKLGSLAAARIAVIGAGTIGQLVVQGAIALGATVELVVDPSEEHRARAQRTGAAVAVHPDSAALIASESPLLGYDSVIECSGAPGTLAQAVALCRRGGIVVAVGLRPGGTPINAADLVLGEKTLIGSAAHIWDVDSAAALGMMATGALRAGELVSHRLTLDQAATRAFELLGSGNPGVMKVLVDCRES